MHKKRRLIAKILALTICMALTSITEALAEGNTGISSSYSSVTTGLNFAFDKSTGTITKYKGLDKTVVIPKAIDNITVKNIGANAFSNNSNLTNVIIPNSVKAIGYNAFANCNNLICVYIPYSVENITMNAFYNCYNAKFWVDSAELQFKLSKSGVNVSRITSDIKDLGVSLNSKNLCLVKGETNLLKASVIPFYTPNPSLKWGSSNPKVVTVNENGNLSAVGSGTATITCMVNDGSRRYATCEVTVNNGLIKTTSIGLNTNNLNLTVGKKASVIATILPSNANNKNVTWKSSNPNVASVEANGEVTGISVGTTTITCAANDGSGKYATCAVTVKSGAKLIVSSIRFDSDFYCLSVGKTQQVSTTILPTNATNNGVTFKSSDTKVVKIDNNGKLTGVGEGIATITCTANDGSGKYATCTVTVTNETNVKVTYLGLNTSDLNLTVGEEQKLQYNVLPSNATNRTVTWKSSKPSVAVVDGNGKITGLSVGTAVITCTTNDRSGKYSTCAVAVKSGSVQSRSVGLNTNVLNMTLGKTANIIAKVLPENTTNKGVTWSSSNTSAAKVDTNGKITAVSVGTAIITCKANDGSGKYATCTVTVDSGATKVSSIVLDMSYCNLAQGQKEKLVASVLPYNAANQDVVWSSSNPNIVTVDKNGILQAGFQGSATITCKAADGSGKYATCQVKVTGGSGILISNIKFSDQEITAKVGEHIYIFMTVSPSNATNKKLDIYSTNPDVADIHENTDSITPEYKLQLKRAGKATIICKAKDGSNSSAKCVINVVDK